LGSHGYWCHDHSMSDDEQGVDPPAEYWSGQELDWDAPFAPVELKVELPFWLMCPDATLNVAAGGHTFRVDVQSQYVELFGAVVTDSRRSTIYIGPHPPHLTPDVASVDTQNRPLIDT
jgi:hypothetical protein